MRTNAINVTDRLTRAVPLGTKDEKGREIGFIVETLECDFVETPNADSWYIVPPGHYFAAVIQPSRNGEPYGPTAKAHYFANVEDRDAEIKRRTGNV